MAIIMMPHHVRKVLPAPGQLVFIPGNDRRVLFVGLQFKGGVRGWCRGIFCERIDAGGTQYGIETSELWSEYPFMPDTADRVIKPVA